MSECRMTRCIEREAAQKILCGWCGVCQNPTLEDLEKCDDICPQFAQIPDADVRPVEHSEWIPVADLNNEGKQRLDEWFGPLFNCRKCSFTMIGESNFCPHCGADMRGGDGNG